MIECHQKHKISLIFFQFQFLSPVGAEGNSRWRWVITGAENMSLLLSTDDCANEFLCGLEINQRICIQRYPICRKINEFKTFLQYKYSLLFYKFLAPPFFYTLFVSTHMYPENPEVIQLIIGSMNMGYDIYPTLLGIELTTCSIPSACRFH